MNSSSPRRSRAGAPARSLVPRLSVRARRWRVPAALLFVLVLAALLLVPLIAVVFGAVRTGSPISQNTRWSLEAFVDFPEVVLESGALVNSLLLSIVVTISATALAAYCAFIAERTDAPFRRFITPVMAASFIISPMFYAMGYGLFGNPYTGIVNVLWRSITGSSDAVLVDVQGWGGLIFVQILVASHTVYFLLVGAFRRIDSRLEEAALVSGASRAATIRRITIPLLTPVLSGIVVLGALAGLQSFDVPMILQVEPKFLSTQIFELIQYHNPPLYAQANTVALVLVVVVLLLVTTQQRLLRRGDFETVTGKAAQQSTWQLGRSVWLHAAVFVLYLLFGLVTPIVSVVLTSFQPYPGVFATFDTSAYTALFANSAFTAALHTSAFVSVLGGLVGAVLAFSIALVIVRGPRVLSSTVGWLAVAPLALPGVVAALGMTWAYASLPGLRSLYGTSWLLLIALVVVVLPPLVQLSRGSIRQVSQDLEDSAVVAGISRSKAVLTITVRLLLPSLLSGWFVGAVFVLGNVDVPVMLGQSGTSTLASLSFGLFSGINQSQAAALMTTLLVIIAAAGTLLLAAATFWSRRLRALATPKLPGGSRWPLSSGGGAPHTESGLDDHPDRRDAIRSRETVSTS